MHLFNASNCHQEIEMKRAMTFKEACAAYPYRFTGNHVPVWALKQRADGSFYAPQFVSDTEWYALAKFRGEPGYIGVGDNCQSGSPSWPLGQSLRKPFNKAAFAKLTADEYLSIESASHETGALHGFKQLQIVKRVIATCNIPAQYDIKLVELNDCTFRCEYGHDVRALLTLDTALDEFKSCMQHAMECAGLLGTEPEDSLHA
jgi:hypothetical protein